MRSCMVPQICEISPHPIIIPGQSLVIMNWYYYVLYGTLCVSRYQCIKDSAAQLLFWF